MGAVLRRATASVSVNSDSAARTEIRREMETSENFENWYRHVGFDWDRVMIGGLKDPLYAEHNGKSLASIAAAVAKEAL